MNYLYDRIRWWLHGLFWAVAYQPGPVFSSLYLGLFHIWWLDKEYRFGDAWRPRIGWNQD